MRGCVLMHGNFNHGAGRAGFFPTSAQEDAQAAALEAINQE